MFKNALTFRIVTPFTMGSAIIDALEAAQFVPCGATQESSIGWAPPRGHENGTLIESVGGHQILKVITETKKVPADVLRRAVDERAKSIEMSTGRKPGKKERREIADEIRLSLLPAAFPSRSATFIWIDVTGEFVVVDAGSLSKADAIVTLLIKTFEGLSIKPMNTNVAPGSAMAAWLGSDSLGSDFSIDRECELRASDESKARVKYANHALDIDEIRSHIQQGKVPVQLSLTWADRVSFVLTDAWVIKKIAFLEAAIGDASTNDQDDSFDADVAIATGELAQLMPALVHELGGEAQHA